MAAKPNLILSWSITEKQRKTLDKWIKRHRHAKSKTAIGGKITLSFTNTSIGTVMTANCAVCMGDLDFSEYDDW
jgi:hypothetical protein